MSVAIRRDQITDLTIFDKDSSLHLCREHKSALKDAMVEKVNQLVQSTFFQQKYKQFFPENLNGTPVNIRLTDRTIVIKSAHQHPVEVPTSEASEEVPMTIEISIDEDDEIIEINQTIISEADRIFKQCHIPCQRSRSHSVSSDLANRTSVYADNQSRTPSGLSFQSPMYHNNRPPLSRRNSGSSQQTPYSETSPPRSPSSKVGDQSTPPTSEKIFTIPTSSNLPLSFSVNVHNNPELTLNQTIHLISSPNEDRTSHLEEKISTLQTQLNTLSEEIKHLTKQTAVQEQTPNSRETAHTDQKEADYKETIRELRIQLKNVQRRARFSQAKVDELQQALTNPQKKRRAIKNDRNRYQAQISKLQKSIQESAQRLERQSDEVTQDKTSIEQLRVELTHTHHKAELKQAEIHELHTALAT